jgi:hypothetical protein
MKGKKTKDRQINIKVSELQYQALMILGGPTAVLQQAIEMATGEKDKLKQMKLQILDSIEKEQQQIQDIDQLIQEYDGRAGEELRQNKESKEKEEERNRNKNDGNVKKHLSKEDWIKKWKPAYLQALNQKGELNEFEYKAAFGKLGLKTKEEVDVWVRSK